MKVEAFLAEDVLAEEAAALRLFNGVLEARAKVRVFFAQVDVAVLCADAPGADRHGLDEVEGVVCDQFAILEGARLALVGVADDDLVLALDGARLRPLASHRVGGTAASLDLGFGKKGGDVLAVHCHGLFEGVEAANRQVRFDGHGIVAVEVLCHERNLAHIVSFRVDVVSFPVLFVRSQRGGAAARGGVLLQRRFGEDVQATYCSVCKSSSIFSRLSRCP